MKIEPPFNILLSVSKIMFIAFLFMFGTQNSFAQSNEKDNFELGISTGPMLPQNFAGVKDIIIASGFYSSFPYGTMRPELKYWGGNEEGIEVRRISAGVKNYIRLDELNVIWSVGLNYTQYKRNTIDYQDAAFIAQNGWYYNFGVDLDINPKISFQPIAELSINPGRVLYIGLAMVYKTDSEEQTEN